MCMQQIYEMKFAARENIPGDTSQKRGKFAIAALRKFANRRKPLTLCERQKIRPAKFILPRSNWSARDRFQA